MALMTRLHNSYCSTIGAFIPHQPQPFADPLLTWPVARHTGARGQASKAPLPLLLHEADSVPEDRPTVRPCGDKECRAQHAKVLKIRCRRGRAGGNDGWVWAPIVNPRLKLSKIFLLYHPAEWLFFMF